ncbi:branched-chain amino acid ABC transporter permease/ATP-binding protein [Streptomyces sp. ICBB 8177]|uniref:ABC transporter permease subunit n=1 Tax=Streptomyces sp. ICBB 8177 TaxID=563922 RepID=UPI000D67C5E1|nr:branched-chain amino acid ABC transporter permease/ATP-binding protein [Streptomyces sp. ICBB 8177]PWI41807.1 ABC transporter permease [Streptomyces sp. ICBB 8177]
MASLTVDLTLAGLAVGGAAALTGIGLLVTYRATGVFNLAHGAVATVTAYVLRELVVVRHWPLWPAAAACLLLLAPAMGLALDRVVFRPLAAREADTGETLVATLGVFVLLVGVVYLVWGGNALTDAPSLVPSGPVAQAVTTLAAVAVVGCAVGAVARWTPFGTRLRAVVDDRRLAVLTGVDADRVAAAGWAFGAFTAGLAGVLLAPFLRLDPYGLSLLVMETMAVAVAAGRRGIPAAVAVALAIGIAQSQLTRLHPGGWPQPLLQAVGANLFVVALLVVSVAGPAIGGATGSVRRATSGARGRPHASYRAWAVCALLFLLPLGLTGPDLTTSVQVPAMAVILLSLVVVTGSGGQISLGQAGWAGLGALFTALLATGSFPGLPALPGLAALALAVVLVAPLGLLTGTPAIWRRGLALALATFAVGVAISRFVLTQPYATSSLGTGPARPAGFTGDHAYYALELGLLGAVLAAVRMLRRGRSGRALAAMRDHEPGAVAAGVRVPALKVATFVVGAALAALGGGMLALGTQAFDADAFDPVQGLLWFAAVVVTGADSPLGALAAAALLVGLDAGTVQGVAAAVVGVLAIALARLPGGLPGLWHRLAAPRPAPRLSPLGLRVRAAVAGPGAAGTGMAPVTAHPGSPGQPHAAAAPPEQPHAPAPARQPHAAASPPRSGRPVRMPGGAPPARLTARGIRRSYGGPAVVDGVDLAVTGGRITAVVGPNGAGKSTLFDCLCGAARPDAGRVLLDGRDVTRLPADARARLGVGRTFQQVAVFSGLTVADNVRVGAEHGPATGPAKRAAVTDAALRLLGLGAVRDRDAADLPTGALRGVELGRALAARPRVLLLDEPAAGLDEAEVASLARVLRALAADGTAVLLVEHDLDLVADLADVVHVMASGRVVASGPAAAVLADPRVRGAFAEAAG